MKDLLWLTRKPYLACFEKSEYFNSVCSSYSSGISQYGDLWRRQRCSSAGDPR